MTWRKGHPRDDLFSSSPLKHIDWCLPPYTSSLAPIIGWSYRFLLLECSATREQAVHNTTCLRTHVILLGLTVNLKKSWLTPSQRVTFIGIPLGSAAMSASPSPQKGSDIHGLVSCVQRGTRLTFGLLLRILEKLTAASSVLLLGLFSLRPLQVWINGLDLDPQMHEGKMVVVSHLPSRRRRVMIFFTDLCKAQIKIKIFNSFKSSGRYLSLN